MAYPHKWWSISYKSSAGQRKHIGQRPMLYRWTTPPTVSNSNGMTSHCSGRSFYKTKFKDFLTKTEGLSRTMSLFMDFEDLKNLEKKFMDFQELSRETERVDARWVMRRTLFHRQIVSILQLVRSTPSQTTSYVQCLHRDWSTAFNVQHKIN